MMPFAMDSVMERNRQCLDRISKRWPARVFSNSRNNSRLYNAYPYYLRAAFPPVADEVMQRFALAVLLYAESVFAADAVLDDHSQFPQAGGDAAHPVLLMSALSFEAYKALHGLFNGRSGFWQAVQGCLARCLDAWMQERAFQNGERPWIECDEARVLCIVKGKAAPAQIVVAGLAELTGTREHVGRLARSIDNYHIAQQHMDDLEDWRQDLAAKRAAVTLVAKLQANQTATAGWSIGDASESVIERRLFECGVAEDILTTAIDHLVEAETDVEGLPVPDWVAVLNGLAGRAGRAREMVAAFRSRRQSNGNSAAGCMNKGTA